MPKKSVLFFLLLVALTGGYSQTKKTDSLKRNIVVATTQQLRLYAIFALCNEWQSMPADSIHFYLQQAQQLSKEINSSLLEKNQILFYRACYYMKTGKIDSVVNIVNSYVYQLGIDSAENRLQMRSYFLKGNALIRGGRYKESLSQFYTVIQMAVASGDNFYDVMSKNSIGWAYMDMAQNTTAVYWFRQAIAAAKDTMLLEKYSYVYSNIASSYNDLGKYDSAEYFITKALRGVRKNQNLTVMANVLNIMADVYINTERKEAAGKALEDALQIRRQIGDTFYLVSDMAQLAVYYASNNQTAKGINTAKEGIRMAIRGGLHTKLLSLYQALSLNYKNAGNFELYSNTMEKIVALKDSTNKENTVDAMSQIKISHDLSSTELELASQHSTVNRKNIQLLGSLTILVLAITVFYLLFKQYRQKEQVKLAQALAREKKAAELAVVTAEENQRKRIAADLHDNLGVQANAILYGTELLIHDHEKKDSAISNLHDTAKDMLVSLRETLWAMKTADVPAAELWLRIINFSKQMQRYYQAISIVTSGAAPENFILNSAKALNIVLIVQEAVNNAARHAMAGAIVIYSEADARGWRIEIKDNGKGFDLWEMKQKKESYGLTNMNERATAAGIGLKIHAEPRSGASILLNIPTSTALIQTDYL